MRVITTKTEAYEFNELDQEAKDNAIQSNYDINFYSYWYMDDYIKELPKDYGIWVDLKGMGFDLEQGSYVNFTANAINLEDTKKFCKMAGLDLRKKAVKQTIEDNEISIDISYNYGHHGRNVLDIYYTSMLTDDEIDTLECTLQECLDKILDNLQRQYDYMQSEEAIIETILLNEYEFTKEGEMI